MVNQDELERDLRAVFEHEPRPEASPFFASRVAANARSTERERRMTPWLRTTLAIIAGAVVLLALIAALSPMFIAVAVPVSFAVTLFGDRIARACEALIVGLLGK